MAYTYGLSRVRATEEGLNCIDISVYLNGTADFNNVCLLQELMEEIQLDFLYDHLPSEAMYFFKKAEFHNDVFRFFDEEDFGEYLKERFGDEW